ncbi:Phosphoadenylyl-sulfate reductase (thioredoxin) [Anaeromyxobacter dehalogenans 2CP-1]|uniref:Adenosine 5'-phosphosulfate reductase n=1 Tax=Anaeromyxobacter dehalogenans (strain ATCC BAA-258 / DSM 21875 / 2CP-1) TaxID=455488 RepID=B8J9D2_ANAD2|nr:phosphoadenylyl-sulfate reductase [Anaeromyxobacter dehalogenans]ACL65538.1 Phosphoadenylyl-sulfate reductase (thioredoxin) [Anaeromyxobacter dehalogenans 2CP-1]
MSEPIAQELAALAARHEGGQPEEILAAAAERFPGRIALACSFGAEDCLLVDAVGRARLPVEIFTIDTGFLFAETYALWGRLEARHGLRIRAVKGDAPAVVPAGEPPPWERDPDACCDVRKVRPLRAALAALGPSGGWVTGIRRDQTPDRGGARAFEWDPRFGLAKVNPLVAWTSDDVWRRLRRLGVPTNPLHEQGYPSIGCAPCTSPVRPGEDPRAGRWRGREKTECGLHRLGPGGERR